MKKLLQTIRNFLTPVENIIMGIYWRFKIDRVQIDFALRLEEFEAVLNKYNYKYFEAGKSDIFLFEEYSYVYRKSDSEDELECEIKLFKLKETGLYSCTFTMKNDWGCYFNLENFWKKNGISHAEFRFKKSNKPVQRIESFFSELEKAFESYLNEQIAGKVFHDENPPGEYHFRDYAELYAIKRQKKYNEAKARGEV